MICIFLTLNSQEQGGWGPWQLATDIMAAVQVLAELPIN